VQPSETDVDGRDKPGHDEKENRLQALRMRKESLRLRAVVALDDDEFGDRMRLP
jgi:hypothetical protein